MLIGCDRALIMSGITDPAFEPRPHRLSKPRTNTSSTNLLKLSESHREPSSPITPADSYVIGDQVTVAASQSGERRSRRRALSRLRAYLNGANQDKFQPYSSDEEGDGQKGLSEIARGVKNRLSRAGTGSSISQVPSAGASSTQFSNSSSSRLLLHETQTSDLDELTRTALEIKEKAYTDSIAAQNHIAPPVNERIHVDSVKSPIRRRSLYTPGIATRTPNDILQKPPPPDKLQSQADRKYYFNPNLPESSPLARLAALELGEGGRSTPTNLEYSHIGGLKLGTLRVTNGTASPTPTLPDPLRMHPPEPDSRDRDEFFTISESHQNHDRFRVSGDDDVSLADFRRTLEIHPRSFQQITDVDKSRESGDPISIVRSIGSPLKDEHRPGEDPFKESLDCGFSPASRDSETSSYLNVFSKSPDRAVRMAQYYMQEFPDSPYSYTESASVISSNTEYIPHEDSVDKESSDDEGIVMSKPQLPVINLWRSFIDNEESRHANDGTRDDALRKLTANGASPSEFVHRPVSSSAVSKKSDCYNSDPNPLVAEVNHNADSGYSSSESFKSNNHSAFVGGKGDPILGNPNAPHPRLSRCISGPQEMPHSVPRSTDSNVSTSIKEPDSAYAPVLIIPNTEAMNATLPGFTKYSNDGYGPTPSLSPRSKTEARKLRKAKRSSQPVPVDMITVQCVQNLSQSNIPPVPSEIALKHLERLRRFPLLEHTVPSLQHVESDDSLLTEEPVFEPIRFPSPVNSLERADSIIRSNLDWPSSRSVKKKKSKSIVNKNLPTTSKAERRKSQSENLAVIADLGTVTESLGGNPYDIARSATPNPGNGSNYFVSHPHQISTSTPRPRTMIGMDEEVASEFARVRSRHRIKRFSSFNMSYSPKFDDQVGNPNKLMQPRNKIVDTPPMPVQEQFNKETQIVSKSCDAIFDNHLGFPGKLKRPQSMFIDAPPVPDLPTKQQVAQWEARILTSHSAKSNTLPPPFQIIKPIEDLKTQVAVKDVGTENGGEFADPLGDWESCRLAWDQRRKTAGDALLLRFQALRNSETSTCPNRAPDHSGPREHHPHTGSSSFSAQGPLESTHKPRPPIQPLLQSPHQQNQPSQNGSGLSSQAFNVPRKQVATTMSASAFENLTGRYAGGLSYGYEPGLGLGGSAGTRSMMTGASRKSVDVSRGYGVDLSDVPIFVAHS